MRLYFKNISEFPSSIHGGETDFTVVYLGRNEPYRKWKMKFPDLKNIGDGCFIESKSFFSPELSGSHELLIAGSEEIVVAGPFGVVCF